MGDIVYTPSTLCTTGFGGYVDAQQQCIVPGNNLNAQTCNDIFGSYAQGQCMLAVGLMDTLCPSLGGRYDEAENTCAFGRPSSPHLPSEAVDTITVTPSLQHTSVVQDPDAVKGFLTYHGFCEKVEHGSWDDDAKVCILMIKDQTPAQCHLRDGKMVQGHCVLDMEAIVKWRKSNAQTWKLSTDTCSLTDIRFNPYIKTQTALAARQIDASDLLQLCQVLCCGTWLEASQICTLPIGSTKVQCDIRHGKVIDGRCRIDRQGLIDFCNNARGTWDSDSNICVLSSSYAPDPRAIGIDTQTFRYRQLEAHKIDNMDSKDMCSYYTSGKYDESQHLCTYLPNEQGHCYRFGNLVDNQCVVDLLKMCDSYFGGSWLEDKSSCTFNLSKRHRTTKFEHRRTEARDDIDKQEHVHNGNSESDAGTVVALAFMILTVSFILIVGLAYLRQTAINNQDGFRYVAADRVAIDKGNHYIVRDGVSP
jgi:hypothetical protein